MRLPFLFYTYPTPTYPWYPGTWIHIFSLLPNPQPSYTPVTKIYALHIIVYFFSLCFVASPLLFPTEAEAVFLPSLESTPGPCIIKFLKKKNNDVSGKRPPCNLIFIHHLNVHECVAALHQHTVKTKKALSSLRTVRPSGPLLSQNFSSYS